MQVPARIHATEKMIDAIWNDNAPEQAANVAHLPGIVNYSLTMPDIHWGYGFPIGGVAAFDADTGIISPGGVGYDINCGVRLMATKLTRRDIHPKIKNLVNSLFHPVPTGLGSKVELRVSLDEEKNVVQKGAPWDVK